MTMLVDWLDDCYARRVANGDGDGSVEARATESPPKAKARASRARAPNKGASRWDRVPTGWKQIVVLIAAIGAQTGAIFVWLDSKFSGIDDEFKAVRQELAETNVEVAKTQGKIDLVGAAVESVDQRVEALEQRVTRLEDRVDRIPGVAPSTPVPSASVDPTRAWSPDHVARREAFCRKDCPGGIEDAACFEGCARSYNLCGIKCNATPLSPCFTGCTSKIVSYPSKPLK